MRLPLQPFDLNFIDWAHQAGIPVHLLLTKADKLKRGPANSNLLKIMAGLKNLGLEETVTGQLFSSTKKTGLEELKTQLTEWLEVINPDQEED